MLSKKLQEESPLGKKTRYPTSYNSTLLFRILREESREHLNIPSPIPFNGVDLWNAYELSWLDPKGKPHVAIAEISVPCTSKYLFESKSLKLYLHSFNQTRFESLAKVQNIMQKDLSELCEAPIAVHIKTVHDFQHKCLENFEGICLDGLDVEINCYQLDPGFLKVKNEVTEERLYSNLLKTNCLVTNQPDWAHLYIHYKGKKIDHGSLLKYIISYRKHDEFHEQCIERIFIDLSTYCQPDKLTVCGRYTRRGGIDINPFRSNWEKDFAYNPRLIRQ